MNFIKKILFIVLSGFLFSSCAKIYTAPDAYTLAHNQKTFAIIPPTVSIAARKKVDAEAIKKQQITESITFQKEIYSWMLKRKMQGKMLQEIQEIETTNALLEKAGYPANPFTIAELCEVLGVDGIMASNFGLSRPMSDGAAVVTVILGSPGPTNEVHATLSISDCNDKKLIWNYDTKFSGSLGSTPAKLVNNIMRHSSSIMPYIIQKN